MNLNGCALLNGLQHDSGPCDVYGIPLGIVLIVSEVIVGIIVCLFVAWRD